MSKVSGTRASVGGLAGVAAAVALLAAPALSSGGDAVSDVVGEVDRQLGQALAPVAGKPRRSGGGGDGQQSRSTPGQGGYTPPLHGSNPHGQGSIATVDLAPSGTRPLAGDPSGAGDAPQDREEVVVGRARGEQREDGSYAGRIVLLALFGNELLGVETGPGETANGPLHALQQSVLSGLCAASTICVETLRMSSETTGSGSSNSFAVASLSAGGEGGISATAAESNGNISEDGDCQDAHGDSTVAGASLGGDPVVDLLTSASDSRACADSTQSQTAGGRVLGLFGAGVPLPAPGCGDGTANTVTGVPVLAPMVCNATDTNGAQAAAPYGVREPLAAFALEGGGTALLKTTTGASESRAAAAAAPPASPVAPASRVGPRGRPGPTAPAAGAPGNGVRPAQAPSVSDGPDSRARDADRRRADRLAFGGSDLVRLGFAAALLLLIGLSLNDAVLRAQRRSTA